MPKYKVTDPDSGKTLTLSGDSPPTEAELHEVFSQFKGAPKDLKDAPADVQPSGNQPPPNPNFDVAGRYASPTAAPSYAPPTTDLSLNISPTRALLTNEPTSGFTEDMIRGAPATVGGLLGATAGMGAASIPAAALGGAAGESARQGMAQAYAGMTGRNFTPGGDVMRSVGVQGAAQGVGQAISLGIGAAANAAKPYFVRGGAAGMKVSANIPEKSGQYALDDLTRLGRAPSDEAVDAAYDSFHSASGTIGRKEAIARSADPFDSVARAKAQMTTAYQKLRAGTLTPQEAVEASQGARLIRDMKVRGNEMAQEFAETADNLKGAFDDFIERGMGPRTEVQSIPIAQELKRTTTPIASRIIPKSEVSESARYIIPERVNVPVSGSEPIMPEVRHVSELVKRARGQGVSPETIMSEAERAIYRQFKTPIESAAEYNVPVETLIAKSEAIRPTAGFAEKTVYRPGEPIYAGQNRMAFGGTVEKVSYQPGAEIVGDFPVSVPAQPGYPEWQAARQAAFENAVAQDFSGAFPRNVNGTPNVLRTWSAIGTGAGIGGAIGGPLGAAVGAVGGGLAVSPATYGAAIRAAGLGARAANAIPAGVYRVAPRIAAGGGAASLADAYNRMRPATP